MLKSKEIADFVAAELEQLRPGEPVPSDLHLYFKSNSHVMLWQTAGTVFTPEMLENYRGRGIAQIWVHKSDWDAFMRYLGGGPEAPVAELTAEPANAVEREDEATSAWEGPTKSPPPPPSELVYHTKVSAKDIETILLDPGKSDREKRALAAKSSRTLLGELAAPANLEEQDAVRLAVSKVVRELLDSPEIVNTVPGSQDPKEACRQIWKIAAKDPEHCHGVNVSTTAVLFALAFGRIEGDLLADIALAGLVHDIGMTALPYQLSQIPRESLDAEQMKQYLSHTRATPRLLSALAPEIPERAALLAQHHHDRHSAGTVSPLSDLAQLIAMADWLDSICCGHWDGKERTFAEGLERLEELENSAQPALERSFNPDILAAVLRWIRSSVPEDALAAATEIVGRQMRSVQG